MMEPEILLCFLPGARPKPSLRAEPGPVIPRGRPVTFVCRGPAGAEFFYLEKDAIPVFPDQISAPQDGSQGKEARFHIPAVSEDTAGRYQCVYQKGSGWSQLSEPLQLQMIEEDVSTPPSGASPGPAPCPSRVSVLRLPALLLTPSPGAPLPLHTGPSAFTPGSGPWSLVPSGHHGGLDPEPRLRGDTELSLLGWVGPELPATRWGQTHSRGPESFPSGRGCPALSPGQALWAQAMWVLPKPSLRAEPGPAIPRGRPVTFVCRGPAGAEFFYLEKDGIPVPPDRISGPQDGSQGREGRFHISAVSEDSAGRYQCLYEHVYGYSELSEPLQLQVTEEDVSTGPSDPALLPPRGPAQALPQGPARPCDPPGRPVTFVCRGPAGAGFFHLEKDGRPVRLDQKSASQDGTQGTEARFHIPFVLEDTAGYYQCFYHQGSDWSERSEPVQLQMTEEDVSTRSSGGSPGPAPCPSHVSVLGLPALLLTPSPGAPLPLHTGPSAFTPGSGPWSLVPSGHHGGLDPEPGLRGDTELSLLGWVGPDFQPPGALPKPSLRVELGPLLPWGRPVTLECRGPAGAEFFYLEKDGIPVPLDQISAPQNGSQGTEARFQIPAVSDDTAGRYQCFYAHVYGWSERSEPVQLQVTKEDLSAPPSGPASRDYTVENSIRLGLAGVALLILVAILVEAGLSQHTVPQGPQK
ncbi:hypothetical protein QTO34_009913 [Cnephaeus nilssonii]|uniref:Ig-like domain-containing protein n=1 Tax=Cnephaeus nilssonii TaxID=3371016 RepID=A0AA40LEG4_CNENI|nr:hypothetical protein QTO34_009913 [Eptesicus nilssonii]